MLGKHEIGSVDRGVVANIYYNWHRDMCKHFNGTEFPEDYPRDTRGIKNLVLNGKHMTFRCLSNYCEENGIKLKEENYA
tara:strand:+ start:302 stop:538 length:237 start_codon:yes stop_codon:yes gene_type:complete